MTAPRPFLSDLDESTGVATITLNRPERMNALTFEVYEELHGYFQTVATEPHVRAVVITGAGSAFCAGGDVREIIGQLIHRDESQRLEFTRLTGDVVRAMRECPRPIIAAVNGTAAGAGAVIAAASDLRIAAESARIAFLFVKVGLAGADMGAAWLLPRLVGMGKATELLLTGEFIDAAEALRLGLYNRVVADGSALATAQTLAAAIGRGPRLAIEATKRALDSEHRMSLDEALADDAHTQAALMAQPEFREAYLAFIEKRPPRFT